MLTSLTFLTIFAVIGLAFVPSRYSRSFFYLPIGIIYFVFLISIISSISKISTGLSSVIAISFSVGFLLYRLITNPTYFREVRALLRYFILLPYLLVIFTNFLTSAFSLDLAGRNFDAYYAIQDGTFLSDHAVGDSKIGKFPDDLLPLDWSASPSIRYGISYVLGSQKFILNNNLWTQAQFLFFLFFVILALTLVSFAKHFFGVKDLHAFFLGIFAVLSPMYLLHIQYFMFGQAMTLPLLIFSLVLLTESLPSRNLRFLQIILLVSLFVAYPAMFYPTCGFYLLKLIWDGIRGKKYIFLLTNLFGLMLVFILVHGFDFTIIFNRIFSWVVGSVSPDTINTMAPDSITIPIFSQFTSGLGLPLVLGFFPYPFPFMLPQTTMLLLNLICLVLFFLALFPWSPWSALNNQIKAITMYLLLWLFFPFFGFVRGNSYLFFKVSVWLIPIFVLLLAGKITTSLSPVRANSFQIQLKKGSLGLLIFSFLIVQVVTSAAYLKSLRGWDSFPQRPSLIDGLALQTFNPSVESNIAISTPTAEEATWAAGLIAPGSSNVFSLGASKQALAVGLTRECNLSFSQKNFENLDYIVQNSEKVDIVENLKFTSEPIANQNRWQLFSAKSLNSGVITNGAGTYPPTILTSETSPVPGSDVIRWSSGQICLAIFSDSSKNSEIKLAYSSGPDSGKHPSWIGKLNFNKLPLEVSQHAIFAPLQLNKGWNLLQIEQNSCEDPMKNFNRWTRRADDRLLCFVVGSVRVSSLN